MSFDRLITQDLFRSGGGPHKTFIEKMTRRTPWKSLWYRLSPYHRLVLAIEKRQVNCGSRRIVAVCEQTKRELIEAYNVSEKKIVVILNGVDHERFNPSRRQDSSERIRREFGIQAKDRVVMFVGSGFRRKGLDRLLRLWQEPAAPEAYLLVVGNDSHLAAYRSAWRGSRHVIFTGRKTNIQDYYAAADVLVLPSIQEAFGNVVLEAFASGLPVITVAGVGAFDKVEGDLRFGILENPEDVTELKTKLSFFLDPARWSSLSREARKVAELQQFATARQSPVRLIPPVDARGIQEASMARVHRCAGRKCRMATCDRRSPSFGRWGLHGEYSS
jgi:UDP-glucose:(heptosyl)LPS alpha-1,3-glucosyltransferase